MPGNPQDSKWFATPRAARTRKPLAVTLSDEARGFLEHLAALGGVSLSAVVESLILGATLPPPSSAPRPVLVVRKVAGKTAKKTPTKRVGLSKGRKS